MYLLYQVLGGEVDNKACGLDDVFPPDSLRFGSGASCVVWITFYFSILYNLINLIAY